MYLLCIGQVLDSLAFMRAPGANGFVIPPIPLTAKASYAASPLYRFKKERMEIHISVRFLLKILHGHRLVGLYA